jgi:hypothetical protein
MNGIYGNDRIKVYEKELARLKRSNIGERNMEWKAKLEFFSKDEKTVLLIAGYSAEDTLGSTFGLLTYANMGLTGNSVKLQVNGLEDVNICLHNPKCLPFFNLLLSLLGNLHMSIIVVKIDTDVNKNNWNHANKKNMKYILMPTHLLT